MLHILIHHLTVHQAEALFQVTFEEPQQQFCLSPTLTTFATEVEESLEITIPSNNQNELEKCSIGNFNQINQNQF